MAILTNAQPEVTATNTVTLTNKTLTSPTISDPTITGTTTNINTTNLVVEDKNIVINDVTSPTDANADGGGISLNGGTTKTINYVNATTAWTSSENFNIASGKEYRANGTALKDVSEVFTNKSVSLTTNTVTGTLAQFNTALSGDDFVSLTGTETLTNKTLTTPSINGGVLDEIVMNAPQERTTISATAATGTVQFDTKTQGVLFFTTTSTGNFTLNVRGNSGTTLNSLMTTGDAITVVFMVTNVTAFFLSALTIDSNAITPKFQNGTAFSAGSANAIDIYSITIFKTGSATFTALASQTKFA